MKSPSVVLFPQQPALQAIYDTAPIGLACLCPDCRYLQINQRLTEICGISVADHLGRSVRDCVPVLADSVEAIVRSIMEAGDQEEVEEERSLAAYVISSDNALNSAFDDPPGKLQYNASKNIHSLSCRKRASAASAIALGIKPLGAGHRR
jgi:PAS domain-containing protein